MAKRKINKLKTFFLSTLCLIVGLVVGFVASIYLSLPDSFEIPKKQPGSSHVHSMGNVDPEVVKSEELSIHFLELGNKYTGDCTFVKVGDTEMLIDAGSRASSINTIKSYIDEYCTDGILEYVIVTHAHQDHYAGFATNENVDSLFDLYQVNTIIDFGDSTNQTLSKKMFSNYIRERTEEVAAGAKHYSALDCVYGTNGASRSFVLSGEHNVIFEILYQKFYEHDASSENDYSVCLQIVHGDKKFLFTGDLEEDGEESLVYETRVGGKNEGMMGPVEVYKAGHHGSKTSSSDTLLNLITPKTICICCCAGSSEYTSKNENQFPTQEFLNRALKHTRNIFVTTLCTSYQDNKFESMNGNIVICSSGTTDSYVQCSNNATKLTETEWFKNNRTLPSDAVT